MSAVAIYTFLLYIYIYLFCSVSSHQKQMSCDEELYHACGSFSYELRKLCAECELNLNQCKEYY